MSVEPDAGHARRDRRVQAVAQGQQAPGFLLHRGHGQLDGRAHADDQGYGERAAAKSALVTAAVQQRLEPHLRVATADVQCADPLGAVEFVRRDAQEIDGVGPDVDRDLAHGLGGIGMENDAAFVAERGRSRRSG